MIVDTWDLDLSMRIKKDAPPRPRLSPEHPYTLIRYEEFDSLQACYVCNTREKAGRTVVIRDEVTRKEFRSGLDCLREQFGVTKAALRGQVAPLRVLFNYFFAYVGKCAPDMVSTLSGRPSSFILDLMSRSLSGLASFPCPAVSEAQKLLGELAQNSGWVNQGYYEAELLKLRALIALQYDHLYHPTLFEARGKALLGHPKIKGDNRQKVEGFFSSPGDARLGQISGVANLFREAKSYNLRLRNPHVPPYNYPDERSYLTGLCRTMEAEAVGVTDRIERYHKARRELAIEVRAEDVKGRAQGRSVFALADEDREAIVTYSPPGRLIKTLREQGVFFYLSPLTQAYTRSSVSLDEDALSRRLRQASDAEPANGYFRGAVVWKPDTYHGAFSVWHRYGGKNGRTQLEDLWSSFG